MSDRCTVSCTVSWGTREMVSAKDSHGDRFLFEVSRTHDCMFVVGSYHPVKHECGICRSVSNVLTEEDDDVHSTT